MNNFPFTKIPDELHCWKLRNWDDVSTTEATKSKKPKKPENNVHWFLHSRATKSSEYNPGTLCCETP